MRIITFIIAALIMLKLIGVITCPWIWVFSPILVVVVLGVIGKSGSLILGSD